MVPKQPPRALESPNASSASRSTWHEMRFLRCAESCCPRLLRPACMASLHIPHMVVKQRCWGAQVRLAALKREEDSISKERDTLGIAKMRHIRSVSHALSARELRGL